MPLPLHYGNTYRFERNKTYLGDCLEIMNVFPEASIDLILCDLPYGITARNRWDEIIPFAPLWEHYERIIKPNGAIVLTGSQPFTSLLIMSNPKLFKYSLVWQKTSPTGFLNAKRMPLRIHEDICVFYKKPPTYNPQKTTGHPRKVSTIAHRRNCKETTNYGHASRNSYDSTERYPTSVLRYAHDKQKSTLHPTQKPLALMTNLVLTYSNPGDLVLDNASGSGTVGLACKNTGRDYIMIDNEEEYYLKSKARVGEYEPVRRTTVF